DADRRALGLPQWACAAAGADDKARAAVRQDVERGPFIGEDERVAQRERAHAGRADEYPFGPPRDAASSVKASRRGFTNSPSPHQTESRTGDASTASASAMRSRAPQSPSGTARFERVIPKFIVMHDKLDLRPAREWRRTNR